tara:strand:+ start:472 stop:621 length:150 start_codon:yes stop_codon:yes gene_type:complete
MNPCYFCGKLADKKHTIAAESTGFGTICIQCKKEAILFWKHHYDLGLLE